MGEFSRICINPSISGYNGFTAWESLNNAVQDLATWRPAVGIVGVLNAVTTAWSRSAVSAQKIIGPATFTNSYVPVSIPIPVTINMAYGLNSEAVITFPATNYARMAHAWVYNSGATKTVSVIEGGVTKSTLTSPTSLGYWPATKIVDTGSAIQYWWYQMSTSSWVLQYTSAVYAPPVDGWRGDLAIERANQSVAMFWKSGV